MWYLSVSIFWEDFPDSFFITAPRKLPTLRLHNADPHEGKQGLSSNEKNTGRKTEAGYPLALWGTTKVLESQASRMAERLMRL